jgi:hypothetical protein
MILAQVINEFLEIDGNNIDLVKISKIKGSKIIKYTSSYFIGSLKKVVYIPKKYYKHTGFFIRNMMNTVMENIGIDVLYCNKLFKCFAKWFLSFFKFIEKYNLPYAYFKEYYYAAFSGFFILIFGKIKNFKLFDIIIRLWIIVDNIFDYGEGVDGDEFGKMAHIWKKDVYYFFVSGAFKSSNKRLDFLEKSGSGPIMECLKNIEEIKMSEKRKNGLYLRFYKLFRFSYKVGGYGKKVESDAGDAGDTNFKILINTCLKTKKSFDIFFYAIDYQKKKRRYI